jgi:hypothetical protein
MAKNIALATGGDDLSSGAEDRGVFDQANVIERRTSTRTCIPS